MNPSLAARAKVSELVFVQEVDGEAVLLDAAGQQYFGLNEVGVRIWRRLEAGRTLGETLEDLVASYDVGRDVLEQDLRALVDALLREKLIAIEEGGDGPPP